MERNIRKSWGEIALISVLITLPISITVIAWRVSLSFSISPSLAHVDDAFRFIYFSLLPKRESKILHSTKEWKKEERKYQKSLLLFWIEEKSFLFFFRVLEPRKQTQWKRTLFNVEHNGIFYATFSLLCRCSNTVVTFYTLFNIETISYWSL